MITSSELSYRVLEQAEFCNVRADFVPELQTFFLFGSVPGLLEVYAFVMVSPLYSNHNPLAFLSVSNKSRGEIRV